MAGAARGPYVRSQRELKAITGMLRWAIGFDYGDSRELRELCDWQKYDRVANVKAGPQASHCAGHLVAAISALCDCGWELSRVPFVVYCDPEIAYLTGSKVLYRAQEYCEHQADTAAAALLESVGNQLEESSDSTFQLTLPNY